MAAVGSFKHHSLVASGESVDNTWGLGSPVEHTISIAGAPRTNVILDGITLRFTDIVTAVKATMRICWDENGDDVLCPDTEAEISFGITTTDSGAVVYAFQLPAIGITATSNKLYVFVKLNAGTAQFVSSQLTYHE